MRQLHAQKNSWNAVCLRTREQIEHGLSEQQWDQLIACAQQFSAEVCRSLNNSVSQEFGSRMAAELASQT